PGRNEVEGELHVGRFLEVDVERATAASDEVVSGIHRHLWGLTTVQPDHVGTEIGHHHCRERSWSLADELDDPYACQRPCHRGFPLLAQPSKSINVSGETAALSPAVGYIL